MRSRQINFFLTRKDLEEVNQFLSNRGCLILPMRTKNKIFTESYDFVENPDEIFQVGICSEKFLDKVVYVPLEAREAYYVEIMESYCIEFSIGGFYPYSRNEFHRGRLYYILKYYQDGIIVEKDNEFMNWANSLRNDFKKNFLIKDNHYTNDFLSPDFKIWIENNHAQKSTDGTMFVIR